MPWHAYHSRGLEHWYRHGKGLVAPLVVLLGPHVPQARMEYDGAHRRELPARLGTASQRLTAGYSLLISSNVLYYGMYVMYVCHVVYHGMYVYVRRVCIICMSCMHVYMYMHVAFLEEFAPTALNLSPAVTMREFMTVVNETAPPRVKGFTTFMCGLPGAAKCSWIDKPAWGEDWARIVAEFARSRP